MDRSTSHMTEIEAETFTARDLDDPGLRKVTNALWKAVPQFSSWQQTHDGDAISYYDDKGAETEEIGFEGYVPNAAIRVEIDDDGHIYAEGYRDDDAILELADGGDPLPDVTCTVDPSQDKHMLELAHEIWNGLDFPADE